MIRINSGGDWTLRRWPPLLLHACRSNMQQYAATLVQQVEAAVRVVLTCHAIGDGVKIQCMNSVMIRFLLMLALLINGSMMLPSHARATVLPEAAGMVASALDELSCHEVVTQKKPAPDADGGPCCLPGQCPCVIMQVFNVGALRPVSLPAEPVPFAVIPDYRSPVVPLMLRPPIA